MGLGAFVARIGRLSFGSLRIRPDLVREVLRHPLFDLSPTVVDIMSVNFERPSSRTKSAFMPSMQRPYLHAEHDGGGVTIDQIRI
jgi:hypothetical protein